MVGTDEHPTKKQSGPRCSVMHCTNKARQKTAEGVMLSFHRYPKDEKLRAEWIKRCRPQLYANMMNRYVCAAHFERRMMHKKKVPGAKTHLVDGAVPSLLLPEPLGTRESDHIQTPEDDASLTEMERRYERDIEMVELSSDEDNLVVDDSPSSHELASETLSMNSSLSTPAQRWSTSSLSNRKASRKSNSTETSPSKLSLTGISIDSDYEFDDDDIIVVPPEELDHIDLQDPLEFAYSGPIWKSMNDKSRRATVRAYFCRIASFLPTGYPRNSKSAILLSAHRYLHKVARENTILTLEEEMLMQRHYALRKKKAKLDWILAHRKG